MVNRTRKIAAVTTAAIAYTAVFLTWLVLDIGGESGSQVFSDLAGIVPGIAAAVACLAAARRTGRRVRLAWLWIAAGALAWAAGETAWAVYELGLGIEAPLPSWADAGYLGYAPLTIIGVLLFPAAPTAVASRLRTLADGLLIGASAAYVGWVLLLRQIFEGAEGTGPAKWVALAYPVVDVVMFSVIVLVAARAPRHQRTPFAVLGLSLLANAFADTVYAVNSATLSYQAGSLLDAVWVAALLLIAVAATTQQPSHDGEIGPDRAVWLRTLLPYTLLVGASAVALLQAVGVRSIDGVSVALGMCVVALVITRQLLSLVENATLTTRLQRTVDELEARERDLHHQAFHDPLTGLANRALFRDRLEHAVDRSRRDRTEIAVMFLDLDDFKVVNDRLGHETGDELLVAVAARLQRAVRAGDTVSRLGGDEFAILTIDGGYEGATRTASRITEQLRASFHLFEHEIDVHASIGVALGGGGDVDADELLRHADLAMYSAKYAGKGRAAFYVPKMGTEVLERLELRNDLERAVAEDQVELLYQPIVDLQTGEIVGTEALARWKHPYLGLLEPRAFIPLAEESGLIVGLGLAVLRQACRQLGLWQQRWPDQSLGMSVNVSARQLLDRRLVAKVTAATADFGINPADLTLEITESVLVSESSTVLDRLAQLRALGVRLAIDDFGTGYSSLAYLGQYPVDALKIDRLFVSGISDERQLSLTKTIIGLGEMLGATTVAEGIETESQLEALRGLGCRHGQGFFFSEPVAAEEMDLLLESRYAAGVVAKWS